MLRSATDANRHPVADAVPKMLLPVSVRTLLSLAHHVGRFLQAAEESSDETRSDFTPAPHDLPRVADGAARDGTAQSLAPPRSVTPPKVTTAHQAKPASVSIRQSSPGQVTRHAESTELHYRLVERAVALGWPRDRIQVVDEDLGKSGTSAEQRSGFQRLIAEIGLGQVGLVLSLDASRLARNHRDWCRLVEWCSWFGTLLADGEQLDDPRQYHDRLLLGLSGIMSEAELHQRKIRLQAGEYQQAPRGELHLSLPVGLERLRDGTIVLNPDEEVQARWRLVFQTFEELGSARAVLRDWHRTDLPLPTRPLRGPAPHEILWQPASASRVLAILHHPADAGADVDGQTTRDPTRRQPGHPQSGLVRRPLAHWPVC